MSKKICYGLAAGAALLLMACSGDNVTEVTEVNQTGMTVLDKGEKLPKCNDDSEGDMIYALDSAAAYICINKKWTPFNGKDGEGGKDGKDGKNGKDGKDGEDGKDGASCTAKALADSSGYKIICGGDSVGVVLNGEKGDKGEQGTGCSVEDTGDGFALVTCGEGENATTTKMFKGMCGETPYNPASQFCDFRDSTIYKYVTIGTQVWMAENLNFETEGSLCYDNDPANCKIYGRQYTWAMAMDSAAVFSEAAKGCGRDTICNIETPVRGICPEGWHIPMQSEWLTLTVTTGSSAIAMEAKGFNRWPDATDAYGFSALPAGYSYSLGFVDLGLVASFWSSSEYAFEGAYDWTLAADDLYPEGGVTKEYTESVRCIRDDSKSTNATCGTTPYDSTRQFCDSRDNNVYKYVTIGTQTWMAENLNHKVANSFCFEDDPSNCAKYGRMYPWSAAMDSAGKYSENGKGCGYVEGEGIVCSAKAPVLGICPEGWHLPDSTEFAILVEYVGGEEVAGKKLKSKTGWTDYEGHAANGEDAYGFTAISAPDRITREDFMVDVARFWTSTFVEESVSAYYLYLVDHDSSIFFEDPIENTFSVRCLKD